MDRGEGRHLEVGFTHTHSAVLSWVDSSRPSDSSPPGSSVHRILQARILVWSPCPPQHIHTAAAKSLQVVSDSVRPHRRQPTRLLCLWDSPGKNTGVGCHFLLQCMKVKSKSPYLKYLGPDVFQNTEYNSNAVHYMIPQQSLGSTDN